MTGSWWDVEKNKKCICFRKVSYKEKIYCWFKGRGLCLKDRLWSGKNFTLYKEDRIKFQTISITRWDDKNNWRNFKGIIWETNITELWVTYPSQNNKTQADAFILNKIPKENVPPAQDTSATA